MHPEPPFQARLIYDLLTVSVNTRTLLNGFTCLCVVCVFKRERERERDSEKES